MSTAAAIAAVKAGRKIVKGYKAANKAGRRHLAKKEIEHDRDIDRNGCIGCTGKCSGPTCPHHRNHKPRPPSRRRFAQ